MVYSVTRFSVMHLYEAFRHIHNYITKITLNLLQNHRDIHIIIFPRHTSIIRGKKLLKQINLVVYFSTVVDFQVVPLVHQPNTVQCTMYRQVDGYFQKYINSALSTTARLNVMWCHIELDSVGIQYSQQSWARRQICFNIAVRDNTTTNNTTTY